MELSNHIIVSEDWSWYTQVFNDLYDGVRNYTFFKTGDAQLADEVAQSVFLKTWMLRDKIRRDKIMYLLYSMASTIVMKKHKTRKVTFKFSRSIHVGSSPLANYSIPLTNQMQAMLEIAFVQIPPNSRAVMLMRCVEGLTYNEISQRLNLSARSIDSIISDTAKVLLKKIDIKVGSPERLTQTLFDTLLGLVSQLRVPLSPNDLDSSWLVLMNGIKQEERWVRIRAGFVRWGIVAVFLIIIGSIATDWYFATKTLKTPHGKIAFAVLPDSTLVTINAGTIIKHKEYGFNQKRKVDFSGEALFNVPLGDKEFVLVAGNNVVKLSNAHFNAYYRNEIFKVKCLTGKIEVFYKDSMVQTLGSGQGGGYTYGTNIFTKEQIDVYRSTAWTRGDFYYTRTPLTIVVEEFQRQFDVEVEMKLLNPQQILYSGRFTNLDLSNALDMLCLPLGLSYNIDTSGKTIKVTIY